MSHQRITRTAVALVAILVAAVMLTACRGSRIMGGAASSSAAHHAAPARPCSGPPASHQARPPVAHGPRMRPGFEPGPAQTYCPFGLRASA